MAQKQPPNNQRIAIATLHYGIAARHVSPVISKTPSGLSSRKESKMAATTHGWHTFVYVIV
jgi:hypothetical protein